VRETVLYSLARVVLHRAQPTAVDVLAALHATEQVHRPLLTFLTSLSLLRIGNCFHFVLGPGRLLLSTSTILHSRILTSPHGVVVHVGVLLVVWNEPSRCGMGN